MPAAAFEAEIRLGTAGRQGQVGRERDESQVPRLHEGEAGAAVVVMVVCECLLSAGDWLCVRFDHKG